MRLHDDVAGAQVFGQAHGRGWGLTAQRAPLFELTNRRYEKKSTIITTNKPFAQWHEVFPNAACVVSLVDRLTHNAEIIALEGKSYRLKEAQERAEQRAQRRRSKKAK